MSKSNCIPRKRNVVIGSGVAVILLAATGYYFAYASSTAEYLGDVITVTAKPAQIPDGFEEAFKDFTGVLLVEREGKVTAITPKGGSINLCGSGRGPECKVVLTAYALMDALSLPVD